MTEDPLRPGAKSFSVLFRKLFLTAGRSRGMMELPKYVVLGIWSFRKPWAFCPDVRRSFNVAYFTQQGEFRVPTQALSALFETSTLSPQKRQEDWKEIGNQNLSSYHSTSLRAGDGKRKTKWELRHFITGLVIGTIGMALGSIGTSQSGRRWDGLGRGWDGLGRRGGWQRNRA
jgi:hypothetical protein